MEQIRNVTGQTGRFQRDHLRPGDQLIYVTDHGKLTRDTGWKPEVSVGSAGVTSTRGSGGIANCSAATCDVEIPAAGTLTPAELGRTA